MFSYSLKELQYYSENKTFDIKISNIIHPYQAGNYEEYFGLATISKKVNNTNQLNLIKKIKNEFLLFTKKD
ncbi:hypothetical protein [Spiroplasma endosymbiont of Nebria brevicollis]|uniref:hypothetical protein n=1 Tax=Spiroplasma endosymbiont of Nebria brevicollis TaxID=3066284 RepID=UPI00313D8B2D